MCQVTALQQAGGTSPGMSRVMHYPASMVSQFLRQNLFFACLDIIIKQLYADIHCLRMQKNGIYGKPKQVRRITPAEFQLHFCLATSPISLEPPEATKARRYLCQGLNRIDKAFLLWCHQVFNISSCMENIWKVKHDLNQKREFHYIQKYHKSY